MLQIKLLHPQVPLQKQGLPLDKLFMTNWKTYFTLSMKSIICLRSHPILQVYRSWWNTCKNTKTSAASWGLVVGNAGDFAQVTSVFFLLFPVSDFGQLHVSRIKCAVTGQSMKTTGRGCQSNDSTKHWDSKPKNRKLKAQPQPTQLVPKVKIFWQNRQLRS